MARHGNPRVKQLGAGGMETGDGRRIFGIIYFNLVNWKMSNGLEKNNDVGEVSAEVVDAPGEVVSMLSLTFSHLCGAQGETARSYSAACASHRESFWELKGEGTLLSFVACCS